jgi:hypothetical protein
VAVFLGCSISLSKNHCLEKKHKKKKKKKPKIKELLNWLHKNVIWEMSVIKPHNAPS